MMTYNRHALVLGMLAISLILSGEAFSTNNSGEDSDPRTVSVDCAKKDSINEALEKHPDDELIIEIKGICQEDVLVQRDNVTLRGSDPASDGIAAVTSDPADTGIALHIREAKRVAVENLKITGGGLTGLMANNANHRPQIEVSNCRVEGNGVIGAFLVNSRVRFTDTVFTGNGQSDGGVGIVASEASLLICDRCMIKDNPVGTADIGLQLQVQSTATLFDSEVEGVAGSIVASRSCHVNMFGGTLEGAFSASFKSEIDLFGVVQAPLATDDFNLAQHDSYVRLRALATENPADPPILSEIDHIFFFGFSNGHFRGSTIKQLSCVDESKALCNASVTVTGASTCGACPPAP